MQSWAVSLVFVTLHSFIAVYMCSTGKGRRRIAPRDRLEPTRNNDESAPVPPSTAPPMPRPAPQPEAAGGGSANQREQPGMALNNGNNCSEDEHELQDSSASAAASRSELAHAMQESFLSTLTEMDEQALDFYSDENCELETESTLLPLRNEADFDGHTETDADSFDVLWSEHRGAQTDVVLTETSRSTILSLALAHIRLPVSSAVVAAPVSLSPSGSSTGSSAGVEGASELTPASAALQEMGATPLPFVSAMDFDAVGFSFVAGDEDEGSLMKMATSGDTLTLLDHILRHGPAHSGLEELFSSGNNESEMGDATPSAQTVAAATATELETLHSTGKTVLNREAVEALLVSSGISDLPCDEPSTLSRKRKLSPSASAENVSLVSLVSLEQSGELCDFGEMIARFAEQADSFVPGFAEDGSSGGAHHMSALLETGLQASTQNGWGAEDDGAGVGGSSAPPKPSASSAQLKAKRRGKAAKASCSDTTMSPYASSASTDSPIDSRSDRKEKNRLAAVRCRSRHKLQVVELQEREARYERENAALQVQKEALQRQYDQMMAQLAQHACQVVPGRRGVSQEEQQAIGRELRGVREDAEFLVNESLPRSAAASALRSSLLKKIKSKREESK